MTQTSFPFESQNTTEAQYGLLFRELANNGVLGVGTTDDNTLKVSGTGSSLAVNVAAGSAIVRGVFYNNDAQAQYGLAAPTSYARTDVVVLRLDPGNDRIVIAIVTGDSSGGVPPLTQTDVGIYEMPLAYVFVPANATAITNAMVADRRPVVGTRTGIWADDARRPANPRGGQLGYNISREIWEGFAPGTGWVFGAGPPVKKSYLFTPSVTPGAQLAVAQSGRNILLSLPAAAPAGWWDVDFVTALANNSGSMTMNINYEHPNGQAMSAAQSDYGSNGIAWRDTLNFPNFGVPLTVMTRVKKLDGVALNLVAFPATGAATLQANMTRLRARWTESNS